MNQSHGREVYWWISGRWSRRRRRRRRRGGLPRFHCSKRPLRPPPLLGSWHRPFHPVSLPPHLVISWSLNRAEVKGAVNFTLLQLCIKHVKQIPVNEILQFQSETSWSWKCLFDNWLCTTFFWKILYESSPFGFGKTDENENFVLIFEKVTNVLGEISSHTFLSNIS